MTTATMTPTGDRAEALTKLRDLVKDINIAMLITSEPDGSGMHGRPMGTQQVEEDGTIWFITSRSSGKVDEITRDRHVAVSYADPKSQSYVFVNGRAQVVDDRAKAKELWNPMVKAWFEGPEDPDLVLVHVDVESADYWDAPHGRLVSLLQMGVAAATGKSQDLGDSDHLELA